MKSIKDHFDSIQSKIKSACKKANRSPNDIRLIGVCKYQPIDKIKDALNLGILDLGQNYFQGLKEQRELLGNDFFKATWHFVGHLQTNKVKALLQLFPKNPPFIQTLDRLELAKKIQAFAKDYHWKIPCLIQVLPNKNPGGASLPTTRSGCPEEQVFSLLKELREFSKISIKGLMILPPNEDDPKKTQNHFKNLRLLRDSLQKELPTLSCERFSLQELSMGMTHDYHLAILEGATMVRIGTGLFGKRIDKQHA